MTNRARPVDITRSELYVFPVITLVVTAALAVLYTKYESVTTAMSICITIFLFAAEPSLQVAMPENFQIPLLPIWVVVTMWLLYGTEAPENHFHSIGEMTVRDIIWIAVVIVPCVKEVNGNNLHIMRGFMIVLITLSLFLPTESSVATLMPPWVLFTKVGLTICLYMTMQIRARIRPHGQKGNPITIAHDVIFHSISPLFLYTWFLVVPLGVLVHVIWNAMNIARSKMHHESLSEPSSFKMDVAGEYNGLDQASEEDEYVHTPVNGSSYQIHSQLSADDLPRYAIAWSRANLSNTPAKHMPRSDARSSPSSSSSSSPSWVFADDFNI